MEGGFVRMCVSGRETPAIPTDLQGLSVAPPTRPDLRQRPVSLPITHGSPPARMKDYRSLVAPMKDYGTRYRARELLGMRRGTPKSVKKGDVIVTSVPFAHIINREYMSMYCDCCIRSCKERLLSPCPGCHTVWYCRGRCREEGEVWHKWECPALKRLHGAHHMPQDFVRLMARVIFRLRDGGEKYVEKYSERDGRRFRDLMNHYADLKKNEERKSDADFLITELKKYIGERFIPNYSNFLGIYGRMLVNRFSFMDKTMLTIGSAMYLAASIFDHACHPNCYVSFVGRTVEIRSLVDMPTLNYSKCRISYVDPVSSVNTRRQDLYKKWFFWCDCRVCYDRQRASFENSIRCENNECQAPVYIPECSECERRGPWQQPETEEQEQDSHEQAGEVVKERGSAERKTKSDDTESQKPINYCSRDTETLNQRPENGECGIEDDEGVDETMDELEGGNGRRECRVCGWEVSEETVRRYQEIVAFTKEKLRALTEENPTMETCLEMLERQGTIFSPMNVWRVRTLDFAFNCAMFNGCWSLALDYGEENMNGMRYYYGSDHPTYSLFLFKLGKAKIYFKEFREGVRLLEEAEPQLKVGLGPTHPIIDDLHLVSLMANEDINICLERRIAAAKKREEELKQKQQQQQNTWPSCRDDVAKKLQRMYSPVA